VGDETGSLQVSGYTIHRIAELLTAKVYRMFYRLRIAVLRQAKTYRNVYRRRTPILRLVWGLFSPAVYPLRSRDPVILHMFRLAPCNLLVGVRCVLHITSSCVISSIQRQTNHGATRRNFPLELHLNSPERFPFFPLLYVSILPVELFSVLVLCRGKIAP
jgi:hypothetical protein